MTAPKPLLVVDCDEVLLHMVVPFRQWLDEEHHIHFDFNSGFAEALRHKQTGELVASPLIWQLLNSFFQTQMHRQYPIEGAAEALNLLGEQADVVILTNIGEFTTASGRTEQLRRVGIDFPVVANRGGKGRPLAGLIDQYRPSLTIFVDDLAENHASAARHASSAWRLHMVGEPELAPNIQPSPNAHARIDRWSEARRWVEEIFAKGKPSSQ